MSPSREDPPGQDLSAEVEWLRRMAARTVPDPYAAEDLAQEALVAALGGRRLDGRPLRPWLARILRNLAWDWLRREGQRRSREAESRGAPDESPPDLLADAVRSERRARVVHLLEELPPAGREVVELRYFRGLNSSQIGAHLGLTPSTVRSRLRRALAELRAGLEAEELAPVRRRRVPALVAFLPRLARRARVAGARLLARPRLAALTVGLGLAATWLSLPDAHRSEPGRTSAARPSLAALETGRASPIAAPEPDPGPGPGRTRARVAPESPPDRGAPGDGRDGRLGFSFELVDPDGRPLSGTLRSKSQMFAGPLPPDPDGELWLPPEEQEANGFLCLQAEADGHLASRFTAVGRPGELTSLGRFVLAPGASVEGVVLDPDGLPLANVDVRAADAVRLPDPEHPGSAEPPTSSAFLPGVSAPDHFGWWRGATLSDGAGRFLVDGLPAGSLRIWASVRRDDELLAATCEPLTLEAGETGSVRLVLRPIALPPPPDSAGPALPPVDERSESVVTVHLVEEGRPLGRATVRRVPFDAGRGARLASVADELVTDAAGTLRFRPPAKEAYALVGEVRPGFLAVWGPFQGADVPERLEPPAAGALEGELLVDPGASAAGRVVVLSDALGRAHTTRATADGRFRFDDKPAGAWSLGLATLDAPGTSSFLHEELARNPEARTTEVRIAPGHTSRVELDLRDEALCRVRVDARGLPRGAHPWTARLLARDAPGPPRAAPARESADGTFSLATHAAGPCRLELERPLELGVARLTAPLSLEAGDELAWSAPRAWGGLEVRCPPEVTLARARVLARDGTEGMITVLARDGVALLSPAPAGRVELSVLASGRWSDAVAVEVEAGRTATVEAPHRAELSAAGTDGAN